MLLMVVCWIKYVYLNVYGTVNVFSLLTQAASYMYYSVFFSFFFFSYNVHFKVINIAKQFD